MFLTASASIAYSSRLLNFLGCLPTVFRDNFFASGWSTRRPTTPAFAFEPPALSWVLPLVACDHASGPNDLACRRPHYGYTGRSNHSRPVPPDRRIIPEC